MIRLGKTFGNLMVDVQPTNQKLRRRAVHIVASATGLDDNAAQRVLEATGYEPKTAIVMTLAEVDADEARRRLATHRGHVRPALRGDQPPTP